MDSFLVSFDTFFWSLLVCTSIFIFLTVESISRLAVYGGQAMEASGWEIREL